MSTTDIIVPTDQAEGTRFKMRSWLKPAGASVKADEAVAEIETDKATMEIVAPVAGQLDEQLVAAGADIDPGAVLGRIRTGGGAAAPKAAPVTAAAAAPAAPASFARSSDHGDLRLSPLVRRLLAQNQLDPRAIKGTGRDGRITHQDVLAHLEGRVQAPAAKAPVPMQQPSRPQSGSKRIPHTNMRRAIAEHMSRSLSVAPHVTAVFEADFSAIIADRKKRKAQGQELTYTAYFVAACVKALEAVPQVNSRWHENEIELFADFNIGIGTALGEAGLVVPVIKKAQNLTLLGIADALADLTQRARLNKLTPAEMQGGTFTISNHGVSGSLVATPIIINQPQSAILGIGKLEKRVIVKEVDGQDTIAIRPMCYVSLTIDHRVIDGFQTNAFLTKWVEVIENWK